MKEQCRKGYTKVKGICTPNSQTIKDNVRKIPKVVSAVLIGTIISISGWLIFNWFRIVTGLAEASPWWQFLIAVILISISVLIGIQGND